MMTDRRKRIVVGTLVFGLLAALTIQDFREFIVRDRGIEFYGKQPWLLAVCLAIGVVVGLSAHFWQRWRASMKKQMNSMREH